MSDYYTLKRGQIADGTALVGFLAGFLGAGPVAWPYLSVGFQTGEITRGFFYFLATISVAGVLGGAVGYLLGAIGGRIWERLHRRLRNNSATAPPSRGRHLIAL